MSDDTKDIHLRVPADVHAAVKAAAKADGRSMQSYIIDRLRKASARDLKGGA